MGLFACVQRKVLAPCGSTTRHLCGLCSGLAGGDTDWWVKTELFLYLHKHLVVILEA